MRVPLSEEGILKSLVKTVEGRIQRQVITKLQRIDPMWNDKPGLLKSLWDEVCVYTQSAQPDGYKELDASIRSVVQEQVAKLPAHEEAALWLETGAGIDWTYSDEAERDPYPVNSDDLVEDLTPHIYSAAFNWTNRRLDRYYERASDQRQKLAREYRYDPNNDGYV
jgi:hypothetical protein